MAEVYPQKTRMRTIIALLKKRGVDTYRQAKLEVFMALNGGRKK